MKRNPVQIIVFLLILSSCTGTSESQQASEQQTDPSNDMPFKVEILDERALEIIDKNAEFKVLASGFTWTEGPLWVEEGNFLLFSDIPNNKVYKLDENNNTTTFITPSGYTGLGSYGSEPGSNALLLNNEGELILMQHGDRRVARMNATFDNPQSDFSTVVDNYEGQRFNSPNDGVFDQSGNLYFTDPPYGLPGKMEDSRKELSFQGVYCQLASGELVLIDSLSRPNGVTLSTDQKRLYVAVSDPGHAVWYQYDVVSPGQLNNKQVFYDATQLVGQEGQQGLPDGMKMHSKGFLIASGPGGVWVFNLEGKPVARIYTGQLTSNCALSTDEKRLFLTADDYILEVALK
ncbi:MAG: SMP-30/gluconolactonase/LRE family protein [Cytophagales bacterium]|nr:SMP-30/gluconolactonase/LRE family protein [Cytophagales bacterium]